MIQTLECPHMCLWWRQQLPVSIKQSNLNLWNYLKRMAGTTHTYFNSTDKSNVIIASDGNPLQPLASCSNLSLKKMQLTNTLISSSFNNQHGLLSYLCMQDWWLLYYQMYILQGGGCRLQSNHLLNFHSDMLNKFISLSFSLKGPILHTFMVHVTSRTPFQIFKISETWTQYSSSVCTSAQTEEV